MSAIRHTRAHICWRNMHARCRYPTNPMYPNYGGRGIRVCDRWRKFAAFLADVGEPPPGKSLDRIDNDGHYAPGNVRWADRFTQARNHRVRCESRTGFKGVSIRTRLTWGASIFLNGKPHYIGSFRSPEDAAHAYDAEVRRLFGSSVPVNFPRDGETSARRGMGSARRAS